MRLGLLTQWYDPEPGPAALPGVLARGLQARGHDVSVVTGFPNYPTGELAAGYQIRGRLDERLDGVAVRRVALYPSHSASTPRRLVNYSSFGMSAAAFGSSAFRQIDALWVNYSPITVAWPMWIARYALRIPTVAHVLDLWPDTILAGGFARDGRLYRMAERPLNAWCAAMYKAADSVAYISPGVRPVLLGRGVPAQKLHYVPMWADEEVFYPGLQDLRKQFGLGEEQVVLLYAGALGEAQGLNSLIEACAQIEDPRFVALIAGSGVAETALRAKAQELGASTVRFIGRVPQDQMTQLMATADICYIGLRPHALSSITMPSKTQAALAAGKAIMIAAEGDVASIGAESGAAFVAHPDDPTGIAHSIRQAIAAGRTGLAERGVQGRRYYQHTFSVEQGVNKIEALLTQAALAKKVAA